MPGTWSDTNRARIDALMADSETPTPEPEPVEPARSEPTQPATAVESPEPVSNSPQTPTAAPGAAQGS